jgi:MoxR-like ATPase
MSCDGNRGVFHRQICGGSGSGGDGGGGAAPVAASFGVMTEQTLAARLGEAFGPAPAAESALESIFDRARRQAPTDRGALTLAEAQTRALFKIMQERGVTPPTHSATGLPKKDAQFGYAALYQTLTALRDGRPLPTVAAAVQRSRAATTGATQARTLAAIREEVLGRLRCMGCGRFAPAQGSHLCPQSATCLTMQQALMRRLKVPASAYPDGALANLMSVARTTGTVPMQHAITGEPVNVTLDGMALALTQGFVPTQWRDVESLTLVEVGGPRIVAVLDATSLTPVGLMDRAVGAAAAASGMALPDGTPITSGGGALPSAAPARVAEAAGVTVTGGSRYDAGRFIGSEYGKARGSAKGEPVEADGQVYTVGETLDGSDYWGEARRTGHYPDPPHGITVGRTLVGAAELLRTGTVAERDGKIEVSDADGHLAAVFDPATATAADVDGTPNASAAQMAAVMAYRAMHPASVLDHALATDIAAMHAGTGWALAVADSGYIALHGALKRGEVLHLGGGLGAQQCPECGKFMGAAGCLAHATEEPESATPPPVVATPPPVVGGGVGPVHVTVAVDAPQVTVDGVAVTASVAAPQITIEKLEATANVTVDAPQVTVEAPQVTVAAPQVTANVTVPVDDLAAALLRRGLVTPAAAPTGDAPAAPPAPGTGGTDPALAALLAQLIDAQQAAEQRTLAVLERFSAGTGTAAPSPSPTPPPTPAAPPRPVGRPVTPEAERTEHEALVAKLRRPAPDPTLAAVPAWARPAATGTVDLNALIPRLKSGAEYTLNDQARKITRTIGSLLHLGGKMGADAAGNLGAFGLFGPPGSGKNELARQFAASVITVDAEGVERQGMPYFEREIDPSSDPTDLIGGTAIEDGRTVVRLGPVGQMLAMGGVVALNEVVRSPKLLTALQSAMEPPREIRIPSPEGGVIAIPVHPSSVVFTTWNPGMEGDADRPAGAPLARMTSFRLDRPSPEEQVARATAFFAGHDDPEVVAVQPHPVEVRAAVDYFTMVCAKLEQDGLGSGTVTPGARELNRFLLTGKAVGWDMAQETLKIYCAQNSQDLPQQWADFQAMFETCFGPDGRDVADRVAGAAPARSN